MISIHPWRVGAILGFLAACSRPERELETNRRYLSVTYQDTTFESFGRTSRAVTGELVQDGDTIRFRIRTREDQQVQGVDFTLHPASRRQQAPVTRRVGIPRNTMPLMGNSVAFLEQLLRRAREIGGDSVTLPAMLIGANAESALFTLVHQGRDSVLLLSPGGDGKNAVHLAVDSAGRILGGIIPLSGTRIREVTGP